MTKLALVIRGPPCSGKSYLREYLRRSLTKEAGPLATTLDIHSGAPDDSRPRTYSDLDSVKQDCILIELGYGGDATKRPNVWAEKLRKQSFVLVLFRLEVSLDEANRRCKERKNWQDGWTEEWWNRYRTDGDIMKFSAKLGLQETLVDTTDGLENAAEKVLGLIQNLYTHHVGL